MERLTFEGLFCDIAQCVGQPGNTSECPGGYCSQRRTWERLKEYEDTGLDPQEVKTVLDTYSRTFGKGVSFNRIQQLIKADREGRVHILPRPGDVLYETDPEHGVVKHTVTDVHWVANTSAVDDNGKTWADYYTEEDIETAHPSREAAEAVLAAGSIMEGGPWRD